MQSIQHRILTHFQAGQLVTVAIQLLQFCVLAHIQTGQLVIGANQRLQLTKVLDAFQGCNVLVNDTDLLDNFPFRRLQPIIFFYVKLFEIFPESFIREIVFGQFDGAIIIRHPLRRKGAEGQEGEYHSQCQKSTDKARSFCESLFHGVLLSVVKFIFSGPHSGEASASAEKRVPFFQKAVIARQGAEWSFCRPPPHPASRAPGNIPSGYPGRR